MQVCALSDRRSLWPTDVVRRQVQGFVISAAPLAINLVSLRDRTPLESALASRQ